MSEERKPGAGQVEDRPPAAPEAGAGEPPHTFAAGSEGGGEEVWSRTPAAPWKDEWRARWRPQSGGERDAARRRVAAHPEVMPPHPEPTDRHLEKRKSERLRWLPVAALFAAGVALPLLFRGWSPRPRSRAVATGTAVVLASGRGRRARRANAELARALCGRTVALRVRCE